MVCGKCCDERDDLEDVVSRGGLTVFWCPTCVDKHATLCLCRVRADKRFLCNGHSYRWVCPNCAKELDKEEGRIS